MAKLGLNRKGLYPMLAIIIGLAAVSIIGEVILRFLGIGYGSTPLVSDPFLHHRHPQNYIFTVHDPSGMWGGYTVYYDENGCRAYPALISEVDTSNPIKRIAFMGDSFVEAVQVSYLDSFSGRLHLSSKEGVSVRNYGIMSYSPILYLLQWENDVRQFKPAHVFLLLHAADIEDDERYQKNVVYSKDKKLIAVPGPGNDWWKIQLRKSYFIRFIRKLQLQLLYNIRNLRKKEPRIVVGKYIEQYPDVSELSSGYILELADRIRKSGSKFTLMAVPSKYRAYGGKYDPQILEFSDKWKKWAEEHSIDFLDLVPAFQRLSRNAKLFFENDIHFNGKGHEVVASVIKEAYPEYFY